MSWYALSNLDDALDAAEEFLLPFDLTKWLKLALVAFFVGGGGGFSTPNTSSFPSEGTSPGVGTGGGLPTGEFADLTPIIIAVVALILGIVLFFGVIGGVMEFVFYDSVVRREVRLKEYFSDRLGKGLRLFGFRFGLSLIFLLPFIAVIASFFLVGAVGLAGILLLIPFFLVGSLVTGVIRILLRDAVVPVMIADDVGVIQGWRNIWSTLKSEWKQYGVYVVARWLLSLGLGIGVAILMLLAAGLILVPLAVVGVPVLALDLGVAGMAILAVLGVVFLVASLVVYGLIRVPVETYLRYYALLVLGDANQEYDLIPDMRHEDGERNDSDDADRDGDSNDGGDADSQENENEDDYDEDTGTGIDVD
ncbi:MAG: hypothetical protein SV253_02270 [Halobacteria archaeon]|nr:hypothetical protein [Halobacteria archaeon]